MALERITQITGNGVYVPGNDIDTDRIIPARYLKCITFDGLGEYAFYDERKSEDGSDASHPLNDERFVDATILLCGSNFGCGSSREHAPQSLFRHGFRIIIGVSFAEIFFGNSIKLGMPCLTAPRDEIVTLASAIEGDPKLCITVDLGSGNVSYGDHTFRADIPEGARNSLLEGRWDPIAELLEGRELTDRVASTLSYGADKAT